MAKTFTRELLQTISDWQQGGNAKLKYYRGLELKRLAVALDAEFRECTLVAFRRVAIDKKPLWELLADKSLPETISAWSLAPEVAKEIKGGVPQPERHGVILAHKPEPGSVVINLSRLYACKEFRDAIDAHKHEIDGFDLGMGKYVGSQSEVVIEKESLSSADIYALGGFSSSPEEIGQMIFGRKATPAEIGWMKLMLRKAGERFGAWWIEGDAKDRVLDRLEKRIPELQRIKRLQEATRKGKRKR